MITTHHISEPLYSHFIHPSNSNNNRGEDKLLAGGARLAASYVASKGAGITPSLTSPPRSVVHKLGTTGGSHVYSQGIGCFREEP